MGARTNRRMLALCLVGAAAIALTGCDPPSWYMNAGAHSSGGAGGITKLRANAPFGGTETFLPGTVFTPQPGGTTTVSNNVTTGTFSSSSANPITLPRSLAAASKGFKTVSGTFVAKTSGTLTQSAGTGQLTGTLVMRFSPASVGTACLSISITTSNQGKNESGSFTLLGGTASAAKARFSGTFTKSLTFPTQNTANVNGTLIGSGKSPKKARPLTADCKALVPQL